MNRLILFIGTVLLCSACTSDTGPHRPLHGGASGAGSPDYVAVRPIFAKYCSECHPSRSGPDWLDYSQAVGFVRNGLLLQRVVNERSMPPQGSPQAAAISDQERNMIGVWARSGGSEPSASEPQSAANPLVQNCLHCHGSRGPGTESQPQPKIPRLAGQNRAYMVLQLRRFKWRDRLDPSGTMNDVAFALSDEEMGQVADHFAKLPCLNGQGPPDSGSSRDLYEKGEQLAQQLCISCHKSAENNDRPLDDLEPVLVGQSKQYLFDRLLMFRAGTGRSPLMHELTKPLSDKDVEALAEFFSRSKL